MTIRTRTRGVAFLWLVASSLSCSGNDSDCTAVDVFADADGDGFGDDAPAAHRCPGAGDVTAGGDCNDASADIFPGATSACGDGSTDDDCDGVVDPQDADADGDGVTVCADDCDDAVGTTHPTAPELCNTIDDDCDGLVDVEDDSLVEEVACGVCPDPADVGVAPVSFATYNPCVLDPTIESLCHRDQPSIVNTHTMGERLHRVSYRTDQPLRDELLLYLPPGPGEGSDQLLAWMANTGYRMISMGWTNENGAFVADDMFFENLRAELAYGDDVSTAIEVGPADSLVGRLTTLLDFLAETEPTMGWEAYRDPTKTGADGIRWDEVVVAGWSEGGSQAGWMARNHEFDGVVLISAPKDLGGEIEGEPKLPPAPWVADPRATRDCKHYGFYHRDEDTEAMLLSWDAIGMLNYGDSAVDVDVSVPPYDDTHVISTAKTDFEDDTCSSHGAMAKDDCIHEDLAIPYNWLFCAAGVETTECP